MEPTVVISLDLELSWGIFDLSFNQDVLDMARWTHDTGVPRLLRHLTSNGLSATWAIVGAMMRPSLPDISGLPEVHYPHFPKPWFTYAPKNGDESVHPEWFGAQLVERLRRAEPKQEIAFHSFSHVPFGTQGMTRERAVAEYRYCVEAARALGIAPISFVFPRNLVAYLRELRASGFSCFRDADKLPIRFANNTLTSLCMIWADFIGQSPRVVEPTLKEGLVAIPGSLAIRYAAGWRKFIPDASRLRRLRKGLNRVRREGGVFHVWFHPENLYAERPRLENVVARFLEELGTLVGRGEVRCLTMGQVASEFRNKLASTQSRMSQPLNLPTARVVTQDETQKPARIQTNWHEINVRPLPRTTTICRPTSFHGARRWSCWPSCRRTFWSVLGSWVQLVQLVATGATTELSKLS